MNRIGSEGVVVVEGGTKVVGPVHRDEAAAEAAALQRKKLLEQQSAPTEGATVEVKQQIFG